MTPTMIAKNVDVDSVWKATKDTSRSANELRIYYIMQRMVTGVEVQEANGGYHFLKYFCTEATLHLTGSIRNVPMACCSTFQHVRISSNNY